MAFNNEVRTALDTDKRQREESSRSTLQKIGLYLKRTIIWIIVLTLIFFFVILILYLYNNVQEMSNKDCGLKVELQTKVPEYFTITKKTPTRAFSWFKAPTSVFAIEKEKVLVGVFSVIVKSSQTFI